MTEQQQGAAVEIGANELADADIVTDPLARDDEIQVSDLETERERAAAASAASAAVAPRRPGPERDPEAPVDPRRAMVAALGERLGEMFEQDDYTPVVLNVGVLADAALAEAKGLPQVPDYHADDSPRERFYDHRAPTIDEAEFYVPGVAVADRVRPGGTPVPASFGLSRSTTGDGTEIVAVAAFPAGGMRQGATTVVELPLRAAQAFGLAVLAATWADPPTA